MNKIQIQQKNSAINFTEKSSLLDFALLLMESVDYKFIWSKVGISWEPQRKKVLLGDNRAKPTINELKYVLEENWQFSQSQIQSLQERIQLYKSIRKLTTMFEQNFDEQENRTGESAPNNTIYINNLNEKVPIDELKDTLYNIFEEYGEIIDIIAKKNIRMRGQAFVIYRDINSAMEAKRKLNAKQLYGKTMRCHFAREKSDVISKIDGTFQIRQKPENYFQMKFEEKFVKRPQQILKAKVQRQKNILKKTDNSANPPNNILFCQGLNSSISKQMLINVFIRFSGLKDVRLAPKNIAFIEYEDDFKAGTALAALNQTNIGESTIKLSYAKK